VARGATLDAPTVLAAEVLERNPAMAFYRKLGFWMPAYSVRTKTSEARDVSEHPSYSARLGVPEDALAVTFLEANLAERRRLARDDRFARLLRELGVVPNNHPQLMALLARDILRGRKVAPGVRAMVSPGSSTVRREAEAEGLDRIFLDAGFEWRQSGCSMCLAMNDDVLAPGERCASSTNRNFEGRQGRGGRTHLMSPAMVAAAANKGEIPLFIYLTFMRG
jgi:hypothetical protein